MPSRAITHIQNTAPGPPMAMAVATPAMLPVPTVADIAVISARNGGISPGSLDWRPRSSSPKPVPTRRSGMNRRPTIR